jgi:hypothetical protein
MSSVARLAPPRQGTVDLLVEVLAYYTWHFYAAPDDATPLQQDVMNWTRDAISNLRMVVLCDIERNGPASLAEVLVRSVNMAKAEREWLVYDALDDEADDSEALLSVLWAALEPRGKLGPREPVSIHRLRAPKDGDA